MFLVGLTGGIATGKSTVSGMLETMGCPVIDADKQAREVVEVGQPAWRDIKRQFGEDILNEDGSINRERLGQVIFNDEDKRRLLNSITHPRIYTTMARRILYYCLKGEQFVVLDMPLLYETKKALPYVSYVVVVACDSETQLLRLRERNNLSEEDALQRINAQMPLADKCDSAEFVIDNSRDVDYTREQVKKIHHQLRASRKHWKLRVVVVALVGALSLLGTWCLRRM